MDSQLRIAVRVVAVYVALYLVSVASLSRAGSGPVADSNPVRVTVEKVQLGTRGFVFWYTVENRSSSPITDVMIGRDYFRGVVELLYAPAGWNGDSVPPGSYTCPTGWTFRDEVAEEDTVGFLNWSIQSPEHAIPKGSTLGGFEVTVPVDDPAYEGGHWTVFLDSADEPTLSGALQPVRTLRGK